MPKSLKPNCSTNVSVDKSPQFSVEVNNDFDESDNEFFVHDNVKNLPEQIQLDPPPPGISPFEPVEISTNYVLVPIARTTTAQGKLRKPFLHQFQQQPHEPPAAHRLSIPKFVNLSTESGSKNLTAKCFENLLLSKIHSQLASDQSSSMKEVSRSRGPILRIQQDEASNVN